MTEKYFLINKGINKPIEFRGLKAQYIGHLAGAIGMVFAAFGVMYAAGVSVYISTPLFLGLGGFLVGRVFRISKKYGQYGLMKKNARKAVPEALLSRSRKLFNRLYSDHAGTA